jgi:hypothetical protein
MGVSFSRMREKVADRPAETQMFGFSYTECDKNSSQALDAIWILQRIGSGFPSPAFGTLSR